MLGVTGPTEQVSAVLVKFGETVMLVNVRFAVPLLVTVTD